MTPDEINATLMTACRFGGGFIARLAEAGLYADPKNRQRLLIAFPELIDDYGPTTTFYLKR